MVTEGSEVRNYTLWVMFENDFMTTYLVHLNSIVANYNWLLTNSQEKFW